MNNLENEDFVLEFIIKNISCKNIHSQSSPLLININGCEEVLISPKNATICKIFYNKGKRFIFHDCNLIDLTTKIFLINGFGDHSIRASCSFNFLEIINNNLKNINPIIYQLEIGMDSSEGFRFGFLTLNFQFYQLKELNFIKKTYFIIPENSLNTTRSEIKSLSSRSQNKKDSTLPIIPKLDIPSISTRNTNSSIHERYMKKNELWIGTHSSTKLSSTRSSSKSKQFSFD